MNPAINGDLLLRVAVDTDAMDWSTSPSGTVFRKRVHLVGPPEAGQVTSLVRYEPNAAFPSHDHPDGEEILVLDGVFSDEHGDWPKGTYLLNPEGFRHRPFSKNGCLLLVKLRQYAGRERRHIAVQTDTLNWASTQNAGVSVKPLYQQAEFEDVVRLERWDAGTQRDRVHYESGAELFVLEGAFSDAFGRYGKGCWLRFPIDSEHAPRSRDGCIVYVKTGGMSALWSAEK